VIVLALVGVAAALWFVGTLGGGTSTTTASTPSTSAASGTSTSTTSATSPTTAAHKPPVKHHRPAPPPKPTKVTVKLVATSPVYVCVEDGSGKRLIAGVIYAPGQTIPTETSSKLLMTFGNSAVQMKVNGKNVPVGPGAPVGYEVTPSKTTVLPAAQRPTCA
jgi:hypothetical protein